MTTEYRIEDPPEDVELEELVKELDAILDAWFMGEVAPALDESRRARTAADG